MKVIVTGGTGHIGTYLIPRLVEAGHEVICITRGQQRRNLDAFKRLIRMAHDRGLNFTVGIWDHIYRGGVQGGGMQIGRLGVWQHVDGFPAPEPTSARAGMTKKRSALTEFSVTAQGPRTPSSPGGPRGGRLAGTFATRAGVCVR